MVQAKVVISGPGTLDMLLYIFRHRFQVCWFKTTLYLRFMKTILNYVRYEPKVNPLQYKFL